MGKNQQKESLRYIFLYLVILVFFGWALVNLKEVLSFLGKILSWFAPIIVGTAVAFIINILMRPMEKLWAGKIKRTPMSAKLKRPVCLALSTLIVLGLIFAIVFMMIPGMQQSGQIFADSIPTYVDEVAGWLSKFETFAKKYNIVLPEINRDPTAIVENFRQLAESFGGGILSKTLVATTSIVSGLISVILGFVFAVYLLAEKEKICYHLKQLLLRLLPPEKSKQILKVINLTNQTFVNFFSGQLIDASILGLLCFIGMLILKLPYAGAISVLIAFTALVPVFGAWIGGGISTILILLSNPIDAVWFLIFLLILQQVEGNFIYPKVVGKSIGLPGILVLVSVVVGGSAFGILGMLLGLPICAVLYSLYKEYMNGSG